MKNFKVLIVEDDESIREGLSELLAMEGFEVATAEHGLKALELLKGHPQSPKLILLDLNMPVMSGRDFLERLQTEEAQLAKIPVVVMTAVPNAIVPGVAGVLRKPIDLDAMLGKVRDFV